MSIYTVIYDVGYRESQIEYKEVRASSDVEAALKVPNMLKDKPGYDKQMEFKVFAGPDPTPIIIEVERSVKLKVKDGR